MDKRTINKITIMENTIITNTEDPKTILISGEKMFLGKDYNPVGMTIQSEKSYEFIGFEKVVIKGNNIELHKKIFNK